ncbi:hypothetical protein SAY87_027571 [Trapa incisa]|uniref:Uncharacterized protein n=1 Tax=Trapa incisa TaxID=236973 RepID=A0AAN7PI79_9MYRT|nr:hypothetical protein SAY87_027571 [Trapa incisa]
MDSDPNSQGGSFNDVICSSNGTGVHASSGDGSDPKQTGGALFDSNGSSWEVEVKSDGYLSAKQAQEKDDKADYMDHGPDFHGGSFNDAFVVNSSAYDVRVHDSSELAAKSTTFEIERTRYAPAVSSGSSQKVGVEPVQIPPPEVYYSKPVENGNIVVSGMEACKQSTPLLEGSSTEDSKELVGANDAQSPIDFLPSSDVSRSALQNEEKPKQVLKEGIRKESAVDSDLNCRVTPNDGSRSDEHTDGRKGCPQGMELGTSSHKRMP